MVGMIVCYKVCLAVMLTWSLFYCDKNQSTLVNETPGKRIYDNLVSFGGSVFRQKRKLIPAFTLFQRPTAQINHYIKPAYFWVAYSATLHPMLE